MSSGNYNIDDILLEAQRIRSKTNQGDFPYTPQEKQNLEKKLENAFEVAAEITEDDAYSPIFERIEPDINSSFRPKSNDRFTEFSDNQSDFSSFQNDSVEVESISFIDSPSYNLEEPQESIPMSIPIDIEPDPQPVTAPKTAPKKPKRKRKSDERVDLFEFQPEKRDKPIRTGAFGEKHFDFAPPQKADEPKVSETTDIPNLEFQLESEIASGIQQDTQVIDTTASDNPFERQFGPSSSRHQKKHDIKSRYNKLIFGENVAQQTPENIDATKAVTGEIKMNDSGKPSSMFSTFATGTGREIKIEDIKKIDFSSLEGAGGYYDDDDEHDNFSYDIPDGSYVNFKEFMPKSNRRDVAKDIANTKFGIFIRTAIIAFVCIVLIYIAASAKNINLPLPEFMFPTGSSLSAFIAVPTVMTALLLVVCANTALSGLLSLIKMQANSDTLVTFSLIGAVIQGFILLGEVRNISVETVTFLFPVASVVLLFNYIGKLGVLSRIQRNFKITAANRERKGVASIESPAYCKELLPRITDSKPTIVYGNKSDFFTDFLALSFSTKYDVGINRAVAPVCIVGSIIVAVVTKFLFNDSVLTSTAFGTVLAICATLSSTFVENIPLGRMSKNLTKHGAMVSGNKAVEDFCDTTGIILSENEIFPKGHVYLNGIKAFPNGRIDDAILDAASVLFALGGSLGYLFLDMIGGNKKLLKKVDNVVYENNMGLSGWVDGRRVLIGNRMLMQNHGIKLPNDSFEKAHPKEAPGNPIYVSNSGEVCARFLVEYTADEELAVQLDQLAGMEKDLIIYTTDANITPKKIWEIYGYPMDLITIMSSELQDSFREMSAPREEMPAEIVYTGKPASFIAAIIAVAHARTSILTGTIIQLVQIIFGYGIVALMAFTRHLDTFGSTKMIGYMLVWFIVITLAQQFKRS